PGRAARSLGVIFGGSLEFGWRIGADDALVGLTRATTPACVGACVGALITVAFKDGGGSVGGGVRTGDFGVGWLVPLFVLVSFVGTTMNGVSVGTPGVPAGGVVGATAGWVGFAAAGWVGVMGSGVAVIINTTVGWFAI